MTCTTCANTTTRGDHVYCGQVGACVCAYVAIGQSPSWCPGHVAREPKEKVEANEVTVAFHKGEM